MNILVVAENSNKELKSSTLNCIAAASKISDEIHVIVIGNQCEDVAKQVALVEKVKKVLHLDDPQFENPQSSSSKTVPCNLSNTGGISTNFRFTFVFGPKVSPLINLGSKE